MSQLEGNSVFERVVEKPTADGKVIDLSHVFALREQARERVHFRVAYETCPTTGWLITNGGYKEVYSPFSL